MTTKELEHDWMSLHAWLMRAVWPAGLVVLTLLLVMGLFVSDTSDLNDDAVIIGFLATYFILFRAGHIMMLRSLHKDLKTRYGQAYEDKLATLSRHSMKRRNIGFVLARIKREFIDRPPK